MFSLPPIVWLLVLLGAIGLPAFAIAGLWLGGVGGGSGRATITRVVVAAAIGWATWGVVSYTLADADRYRFGPGTTNPLFGIAGLAAIAAALAFTRLPVVARILDRPDMLRRLTLPQSVRVVGVSFLIAFALGKLPAVFALPAGLGDIAIGIEAMIMTRMLGRGAAARAALWFNVFGIIDLVVATGTVIAAAPGAGRLLTVTPSTEAVSMLPLVLIPTVAVPIALTLHVLSLTKIRAAARSSRLTDIATPAISPSTRYRIA